MLVMRRELDSRRLKTVGQFKRVNNYPGAERAYNNIKEGN